jgi:hypothetical protein
LRCPCSNLRAKNLPTKSHAYVRVGCDELFGDDQVYAVVCCPPVRQLIAAQPLLYRRAHGRRVEMGLSTGRVWM